MKLLTALTAGLAIVFVLFALTYWLRSHPDGERVAAFETSVWQGMASPGLLSSAHAFMEHDCAGCHTAVKGPEATNCISCHANNTTLLSSQTTAFHADAGDCRGCHAEHLGANRRPTVMDHLVLSRLEAERLPEDVKGLLASVASPHARIAAEEAVLNCSGCHANQDPHRSLMGTDCAQCHATNAWAIAEFQHPSALSTDCAQCHQAPPSHYMMHFSMVSMSVARVEHAEVGQCFQCHQTNAWNDIKGVGWYKHY